MWGKFVVFGNIAQPWVTQQHIKEALLHNRNRASRIQFLLLQFAVDMFLNVRKADSAFRCSFGIFLQIENKS